MPEADDESEQPDAAAIEHVKQWVADNFGDSATFEFDSTVRDGDTVSHRYLVYPLGDAFDYDFGGTDGDG